MKKYTVATHKGKIKFVGASSSSAGLSAATGITSYSHIEMDNGDIISAPTTNTSLAGLISSSVTAGDEVNLHVMTISKKVNFILAVERDGKTYIIKHDSSGAMGFYKLIVHGVRAAGFAPAVIWMFVGGSTEFFQWLVLGAMVYGFLYILTMGINSALAFGTATEGYTGSLNNAIQI